MMDELDRLKKWEKETKYYKEQIKEALKLKGLLKKKGVNSI